MDLGKNEPGLPPPPPRGCLWAGGSWAWLPRLLLHLFPAVCFSCKSDRLSYRLTKVDVGVGGRFAEMFWLRLGWLYIPS